MSGETKLSPKQAYDERRRLRIENDLRAEQHRKERAQQSLPTDKMDAFLMRFVSVLERLADVAELWADQQEPRP